MLSAFRSAIKTDVGIELLTVSFARFTVHTFASHFMMGGGNI
jgi:hypothetical protein